MPWPPPLIPERDLIKLHTVYRLSGLSLPELAEQVWERYGYATAHTCERCLFDLFARRGLRMRSRAEVTRLLHQRNPQRYARPLTWTRERCIEEGVRWHDERGELPRTNAWRLAKVSPSLPIVYRRFGTWAAFQDAVAAEVWRQSENGTSLQRPPTATSARSATAE